MARKPNTVTVSRLDSETAEVLCAQCGQPEKNHVCPTAVVPEVVRTGAVIMRGSVLRSVAPTATVYTCAYCGSTSNSMPTGHHKGSVYEIAMACLMRQRVNAGFRDNEPLSADFLRTLAAFVDANSIQTPGPAPKKAKAASTPATPTTTAPGAKPKKAAKPLPSAPATAPAATTAPVETPKTPTTPKNAVAPTPAPTAPVVQPEAVKAAPATEDAKTARMRAIMKSKNVPAVKTALDSAPSMPKVSARQALLARVRR